MEKLIDTVHKMHNKTTWNEKLIADKLNHWYPLKDEVDHYTINSLLFLTMTREKYVEMCERFIKKLPMYANAIRVLS